MKTKIVALALIALASLGTVSAKDHGKDVKKKSHQKMKEEDEEPTYVKAVRLINLPNGDCSFEYGKLQTKVHMDASYFFAQTKVDAYEKVAHPAPRMQYVVTLRGKLKFKVSNGDTFTIEPGVVLVAEDCKGKGHTWDLVDGDKWDRIYIAIPTGGDDHFIKDKD
ncbi:hypothetical protein ACSBL2_23405 [Pedobacter sp. AW31-3R]|uniref:hypothetical protein n=1 Tax=Pedobacter sp. AW31-3R TaxID=3445781 RepID=UPI003FA07D5E